MKKKKELAFDLLKHYIDWLRCPLCKSEFLSPKNYSMRCSHNHQFDLSKKGTLYFLTHDIATDYNQEMLSHRRRMLLTEMYQPMIGEIGSFLPESDLAILDAGCGEGTFLNQLINQRKATTDKSIGLDISKDGIYLASDYLEKSLYLVGDITNLPVHSNSVDAVMNILSPSHYDEFQRVLSSEGLLIKVVPNQNYLVELRELLYQDIIDRSQYSNQLTIEKFASEMDLVESNRLSYTFPIKDTMYEDLLVMSPLYWGASVESKKFAESSYLTDITVDLTILIGKKKKGVAYLI